ncbi:NAD(P)H-binding protein [Levilactobacillus namurensis]|uniref:NAD(P)H-binding protein n=1 Tax=Levilactobacillus namurensis TaxID=380393 RepID=UPI001E180E5A|nr:NAD(P)H-binding protein [Levilactobacillus namurensis]HJE45776.1 NAD(P)H-binding protein [Levilactobacillus namurensis]
MHKVLLLGATGTAGTAIRQALLTKTNVTLTLVARHTDQLTPVPGRETVQPLDVHDQDALAKVMDSQTIVLSALSAEGSQDELAQLAQDIVQTMQNKSVTRLIFMVAMGIYNEIPASVGSQDNVNQNPEQIHNLKAAQVVENSPLDYTLLRPGFLISGPESVSITHKGEPVSGNTTSLSSLGVVATRLVTGELKASCESLGLNQPPVSKN